MDNSKKIKVAWVCSFMNQIIRDYVPFKTPFYEKIIRNLFHLRNDNYETDYAIWDTNAIQEASKRNDLDVYVIFPLYHIKKMYMKFDCANIHYIGYRSEDDFFFIRILNKCGVRNYRYVYNGCRINKLIKDIKPNIIHIFGAENFQYSNAIHHIPKRFPIIVQLQTLLNDPIFNGNYVYSDSILECRRKFELNILKRADYIGVKNEKYRNIIKTFINNPHFLDTSLAVGPMIQKSNEVLYDCVYFSANINKAFDDVLEVLIVLKEKLPNIKCVIIGDYDSNYKNRIDNKISEYGLNENLLFLGSLPSYNDVISNVLKAKVALLPLKVDLISSTIREAMACGIPVVTTITDGTPVLNEEYKTVLLSEKGDYNGMAEDVYLLLNNKDLYKLLSENSLKYVTEHFSNQRIVEDWVDNYKKILKSDEQ